MRYYRAFNVMEPSLQYEAEYYKNLFSDKFDNKNYGKIVCCIDLLNFYGN